MGTAFSMIRPLMLCCMLLSTAFSFLIISNRALGLHRSLKLHSRLYLSAISQESSISIVTKSRITPWSIGNDPCTRPVEPYPATAALQTNAETYLELGLPVHAIGEINRAQLLPHQDSNMESRLHYLKAKAYLTTNNIEQAIHELLSSIASLQPALTSHLLPVVRKISFPLFSPLVLLGDLDALPKKEYAAHITALLQQSLTKLVADYQSKAKLQIKSFAPRRFRHTKNGGRDKVSIINDCFLDNPVDLLNQGLVEIQESGPGQYGLHALREFAAGEVIFGELPIFSLSADQSNKHGCSYCWKPFANSVGVVKCNQCDEKYCSSVCRNQAKQKYHNQLCGPEWKSFLKFMKLNQPLADRNFVICLAIIATAMAVENGKVSPLNLPRMRNLYRRSDLDNEPNTTGNPSDLIFDSYLGGYPETVVAKFVELCPTLVRKGIGHAGQVLEIADAIQSNSFGGETKMGIQYSAAYQVTAMMNHDCSSNAKFSFDVKERGHEIAVIAVKPITKGEALSITYLSGQHEADEMIEMLRESFGFTCGCKRCKTHLEQNNGQTRPFTAPSKFEGWS